MLWSNNAEDIYDFEINRIEPLRIPFLSRLTGPFRYDFFVGSLKGHTYPNDPWVHMEKISFKPTRDLEFGFDRLTIWGGKGHEPITLHTFLHSFFSFQNVTGAEKQSANDPGARFGTFDFSYRLPFLRRWVTLYTDSLVHDDVSPISAPRRSGMAFGDLSCAFSRIRTSRSARGGSQYEHVECVRPDWSIPLLRDDSAAGPDQQGLSRRRLGGTAGHGWTSLDNLSLVSAGRCAVHVPEREGSERFYSRRHDAERL